MKVAIFFLLLELCSMYISIAAMPLIEDKCLFLSQTGCGGGNSGRRIRRQTTPQLLTRSRNRTARNRTRPFPTSSANTASTAPHSITPTTTTPRTPTPQTTLLANTTGSTNPNPRLTTNTPEETTCPMCPPEITEPEEITCPTCMPEIKAPEEITCPTCMPEITEPEEMTCPTCPPEPPCTNGC